MCQHSTDNKSNPMFQYSLTNVTGLDSAQHMLNSLVAILVNFTILTDVLIAYLFIYTYLYFLHPHSKAFNHVVELPNNQLMASSSSQPGCRD